MPLIRYVDMEFKAGTEEIIDSANDIIDEYTDEGYSLTLRQLYYQFVSRGLIDNKQSEYKRLGSIINNARLAGLIDWNAIEDRTRYLRKLSHWASPKDIIRQASESYHEDMWLNQAFRVEVWIEKDALVGVIEEICDDLDIPHFSCRGYVSQSEMWTAAQRILKYEDEGKTPIILHLGDHDPSGIDMTHDIQKRLELFGTNAEILRIALTMDQINAINPPPNPAKLTDSRCRDYIMKHGNKSWELDALEPKFIKKLIDNTVSALIDIKQWAEDRDRIAENKERLLNIAEDME